MLFGVRLSREEGPRLAFSGCRQANSLKCLKWGLPSHAEPRPRKSLGGAGSLPHLLVLRGTLGVACVAYVPT